MGLAIRNCDWVDVIFYVVKWENNSKTVLGGGKKKKKSLSFKNWSWLHQKSDSAQRLIPHPLVFILSCPSPFIYLFIFGRLAILILLQGCILIHLILQFDKALWHLCSFVLSWWMNSKKADPSWVPPSMTFSVKPNRRQ